MPTPPSRPGERDLIWREWHGLELLQPDWGSWSHSLAWSLHDLRHGPLLWCGMNAYYQPMTFKLPEPSEGWLRLIDTGQIAGEELLVSPQPLNAETAALQGRSLMLLVAPHLIEATGL